MLKYESAHYKLSMSLAKFIFSGYEAPLINKYLLIEEFSLQNHFRNYILTDSWC